MKWKWLNYYFGSYITTSTSYMAAKVKMMLPVYSVGTENNNAM